MHKRITAISFSICIFILTAAAFSADIIKTEQVTISLQQQFETVRPDSNSALAIHFEAQKDWHFYASEKTAPGGQNLKITPSKVDNVTFSAPIFPAYHLYTDAVLEEQIEVFSNKFTVYLPFKVGALSAGQAADIKAEIKIEGAMCSGEKCLMPKFPPLTAAIKVQPDALMDKPAFALPEGPAALPKIENEWAGYPVWIPLLVAFLAGLTLNIMPCVLPVIPLKVLSIFEQARQDRRTSILLGSVFCIGILLFFAILAGLNISLHLSGQGSFQWGGHFQNPTNIIIMVVILIALALFMFGTFEITVPSFLSGGQNSKGLTGSFAMGFFAAVLSTPCSFGILTASLLWAQTQNLFIGTVGIMMIGIGMAAPYFILTSLPNLLKFMPKPGRWTEIFKQSTGFILIVVALWLATALPADRFVSVLYFGVILSFCLWMWGSWVTFSTPKPKKYIVRLIALAILIPSGIFLLPKPPKSDIDWQTYDAVKIKEAIDLGRPVLIEFTADWCLNCKAVEKFVYGSRKVSRFIKQKGVLAFTGDATQESFPAAVDLANVYNEFVPVTIFYVPGQAEPVRLRGVLFEGKLLEILNKLPDKPQQEKFPEADTNDQKQN